jgi:hypothetical protein
MLCGDIIAVYCGNSKKHINTVCGQNAKFFVLQQVILKEYQSQYQGTLILSHFTISHLVKIRLQVENLKLELLIWNSNVNRCL